MRVISNVDFSDYAKHALVLMVVALDESWKLPIRYFLTNSIDADIGANLITSALIKLHEVGVKILSLTFDGPSTHLAMINILGANFNSSVVQPWFLHPVTQETIYVILDACHMLKLIRDILGDWKTLLDGNGNKIE